MAAVATVFETFTYQVSRFAPLLERCITTNVGCILEFIDYVYYCDGIWSTARAFSHLRRLSMLCVLRRRRSGRRERLVVQRDCAAGVWVVEVQMMGAGRGVCAGGGRLWAWVGDVPPDKIHDQK